MEHDIVPRCDHFQVIDVKVKILQILRECDVPKVLIFLHARIINLEIKLKLVTNKQYKCIINYINIL